MERQGNETEDQKTATTPVGHATNQRAAEESQGKLGELKKVKFTSEKLHLMWKIEENPDEKTWFSYNLTW